MTEITQADRSMAAKWDEYLLPDTPDIVQAFARHREQAERETVEKIVAWLRDQDGHGYDDVRANCIEAGEWKQ